MELLVKPIGSFCCDYKYKQDLPRQGVLNKKTYATIELTTTNTPQCLQGLEGFSHIWLIYMFHKNNNWKPMVTPPRIHPKKVGVFASRSPYRPNPIGLSLVKLESIKNNIITVSEFDLIDQTPILDIKPYINYSDSREKSLSGWINEEAKYKIVFDKMAREQTQWLFKQAKIDLNQIIETQLSFKPYDKKIKRIAQKNNHWILSYRTWRIQYVEKSPYIIQILKIASGYSKNEMQIDEDKYQDKDLHKKFKSIFY